MSKAQIQASLKCFMLFIAALLFSAHASAVECRNLDSVNHSAIAANNSAAGGHVTQHIYGAIPPAGSSQLNKTLFTSVAEYTGFWNNYSNPEKYKGDAVKCSGNHVRQKVTVHSVLNKDTIGGYSCKQANPNGQCSDQTRRKFSHVQMDFEVVNKQWILLTAYPTD
jgi:hypothetical protein